MTEEPTELSGQTPEPGSPERSSPVARPQWAVGIGGSAGALGGYERLFLGLPSVSGLAFVVVPHLEPNHAGLMPGILARCTGMPVVQIEDGMPLLADRVHVVPPGYSLSLAEGRLYLRDLTEAHGLVIDAFFAALAADQRERAVAVVLSGLGDDGARGVRAVKTSGGRVLIEDPATAEYPQMPGSAAATGLGDAVLPVDGLAGQLLALAGQLPVESQAWGPEAEAADPGLEEQRNAFQQILRLLQSRSGHDFTRYKDSTLLRRIDRRAKAHGLQDMGQYLQLLQESAAETKALFQDFTINVTSFFRDTEAFESLKGHLRTLLAQRGPDQGPFRVWVAACSTGEEAYSVAMVLQELAEERREGQAPTVQIFATDIDPEAIARARQGRYSRDIAYVVSPERLTRYFVLRDDAYQIRADLRESVIFAAHSTFDDPPFTHLDLLCCRNLLIYLSPELQKRVLELFVYALNPAGLLFLGPSETVNLDREQFTALDLRWKVYRRGEDAVISASINQSFRQGASGLQLPAPQLLAFQRRRDEADPVDLPGQVQRALLADYAPPTVVVNEQGEVLYVHGRTARFLEYPTGRVTSNLFDLVPARMRHELRSAVRQAALEHREVVRPQLQGEGGGSVDLTVKPLRTQGPGPLLVVFEERPEVPQNLPDNHTGQILALEAELWRGRETLQATVEAMAVSVEELRSSNEELQSTNEELQSSNEELMTSKEELQSLNEELTTVNADHQRVIQHQAEANDDTRNLLENAGAATLFLGPALSIKRFTPLISRIVRLAPGDEGRPLTDFNVTLRYEHLTRDIGRVLETLEPFETQVQTHDGAWYLMRISPYRTFDNLIDGVVVAFTDIGAIKALEWRLVESLSRAKSEMDDLQDPLLLLDQHLQVVKTSRELLSLLGAAPPIAGSVEEDAALFAARLLELQSHLRDVIASEEPLSNSLRDLSAAQRNRRRIRVEAELLPEDGRASELKVLRLDAVPEAGPDPDT